MNRQRDDSVLRSRGSCVFLFGLMGFSSRQMESAKTACAVDAMLVGFAGLSVMHVIACSMLSAHTCMAEASLWHVVREALWCEEH